MQPNQKNTLNNIISIKLLCPGWTYNYHISSHRPNFAPPLLPHTCVSWTKWPCIKNGKKSSCIHHFSVCSFTIFQIYLCVQCEPTILGIFSHRPNFAPLLLPPACIYFNQAGNKKGKKHHAFSILQFVHSPFFQLYQCDRCEPAILGISYHRPSFAPPLLPPACIYYNWAAV